MTEGQRILYIRKLIQKSQQEFAQLLAVSQAALSDIENGKNGISYPVFKRLVEEIGVHPYWFLWGQEPVFRDASFAMKYNISYNRGGSIAVPAPQKTVAKAVPASTPSLEDVIKELTALRGEVNKIKRSGKKRGE